MARMYNFPNNTREIEKVSSPPHTSKYGDGNGGGSDMFEARVAKLEADVENIKINLAEARSDIRDVKSITSKTDTDVSVILQKLIDIDEKISSKAGKDFVANKSSELKVWMLGILLLSIAMPVITFLLNLYMKKP